MNNPDTTASPEEVRQPLQIFPAGLSLICPGLGQLIQGRMIFLLLLVLWILILADGFWFFTLAQELDWDFSQAFIVLLTPFGWSFLLAIPFVLLSVLDAATWERGKPLPFKRYFIRLAVLLVLLSIFTWLLQFTFSAVNDARGAALRMYCAGRMNQLSCAFYSYHETHGSFPPAYTVDENGKPLHSWRVLLLPFMEHKELYEKIRLDEPWDSEYNRQFHEISLGIYQCPASARSITIPSLIRNVLLKNRELFRMANCDYSVIVGEETIFPGTQPVTLNDITDGPENTILIVERLVPVCWMDPNNEIRFETACEGVNKHPLGIGSEHRSVVNVGMAHGHYRYIDEGIKNIKPLLTKSAGDEIEAEW